MLEIIREPWPWYVGGALAGLVVPALLLFGNKHFGISSTLRHICAACWPANIPFFKYNWRREMWNLFFVAGIVIGGLVATQFLSNPNPIQVSEKTVADLAALNISVDDNLMPASIFSYKNLFTAKGLVFFVLGGFMIGFGTRYAGGCTSGHAIMGLSGLQWPSLVATTSFLIGGFTMVHILFPFIAKLI